MSQTKRSRLKVFTLSLEIMFWQMFMFFISIHIISFIETILSVVLDYDSVKSHTSIATTVFCLFFFLVVTIPTTVAAIINRPRLFWIVAFLSLLVMEVLVFMCFSSFSYVSTVRGYVVVTVAVLITFAISLSLFKVLRKG